MLIHRIRPKYIDRQTLAAPTHSSTTESVSKEEGEGILQHLHLQSLEAGAPRHRRFQQDYVCHEQLCERHLRENCSCGFQASSLQQTINNH